MSSRNIVMVASEVAPFAKTGGLADMVAGLSRALSSLGHSLRVLFPRYPSVLKSAQRCESLETFAISLGGGVEAATLERVIPTAEDIRGGAVSYYALRHDGFFNRRGLYQDSGQDYPDNLARFALFCRGAIEICRWWTQKEGWTADVVHVHDWQTALVPVYLKALYADQPECRALRTVMTLHNVGYQGIFPGSQYDVLGLPARLFAPHLLEFFGSVNLLKGGMVFADQLTTVSPTYSREIQTPEFGFGLEGVLRGRQDRLVGIINGIDTDVWNPEQDSLLPARYSRAALEGKAECKRALQRECRLPLHEGPILGVVSRLAAQKGIDLIVEAVSPALQMGAQLIVLGTGELEIEESLRGLQASYPGQVRAYFQFDEGLAHRIQAGADMFLVPSRYEPCGLTQLCSLRYGTVPIVRRTGGLADTVTGVSPDSAHQGRANGFVFDSPTPRALQLALMEAIRRYANKPEWLRLVQAGMGSDVSWRKPAKQFEELYTTLMR